MQRFQLTCATLVLAILVTLTGCIDGRAHNFVRYDAATDSFHFLDIYTNISSNDPLELAYVADLWRRRDNLVVNLLPKFELFSSPNIWERDGSHKYNVVPIADPPESLTSVATKADLSKIKVNPGKFFRNEHGNLCYHHENVVPGAVIDAVLIDAAPIVSNLFAGLAEEQIASADKTEERITWDQFREIVVSRLQGSTSEESKLAPLPLDGSSLQMLIKAGRAQSIKITRDHDAFSLSIPMSEADVRQVIATWELAQEILPNSKNAPEGLRDVFSAVTIRKPEAQVLTATISVRDLTPIMLRLQRSMPAPNADIGVTYRTTIASLRADGIPVATEDLFPNLIHQFEAESKKSMTK